MFSCDVSEVADLNCFVDVIGFIKFYSILKAGFEIEEYIVRCKMFSVFRF